MAEVAGIRVALTVCNEMGCSVADIKSDSQLLIIMFNGEYAMC